MTHAAAGTSPARCRRSNSSLAQGPCQRVSKSQRGHPGDQLTCTLPFGSRTNTPAIRSNQTRAGKYGPSAARARGVSRINSAGSRASRRTRMLTRQHAATGFQLAAVEPARDGASRCVHESCSALRARCNAARTVAPHRPASGAIANLHLRHQLQTNAASAWRRGCVDSPQSGTCRACGSCRRCWAASAQSASAKLAYSHAHWSSRLRRPRIPRSGHVVTAAAHGFGDARHAVPHHWNAAATVAPCNNHKLQSCSIPIQTRVPPHTSSQPVISLSASRKSASISWQLAMAYSNRSRSTCDRGRVSTRSGAGGAGSARACALE